MSSTTPTISDKRCLRTREALEGTLFRFFIEHQYSEKLSVVSLCKSATVSTPTFYRHYRGVLDVMEMSRARVRNELATMFERGNSLLIGFTRLFYFVNEHELFYRCSVAQMSAQEFEDVAEIIRPKVKGFIGGDEELCFEIENYITTKLKWWITRDELDEGKIDAKVREILEFIEQKVKEVKRQN